MNNAINRGCNAEFEKLVALMEEWKIFERSFCIEKNNIIKG